MKKILSFGELLVRLTSTGDERMSETPFLRKNYGGCEANVAVSLANFGEESHFFSVVPKNFLGRGAKQFLQTYGVNTSSIIETSGRMGMYFVEKGIGMRGDQVEYDRAGSAFTLWSEQNLDFDALFADVSLFFTSGISLAVSPQACELAFLFMREAKKREVKLAFDINFREKLWTYEEAREILGVVLPSVDYLSAAKRDVTDLLALTQEKNQPISFYFETLHAAYPNLQAIFSTERVVYSADCHELRGNFWKNGAFVQSSTHKIVQIADRIGAGDAYTAGILYGLLEERPAQETVQFATGAAALKHTIYGDCNPFSVEEVTKFLCAEQAGAIQR